MEGNYKNLNRPYLPPNTIKQDEVEGWCSIGCLFLLIAILVSIYIGYQLLKLIQNA